MLALDPTLAPICAKVEWAKKHIRDVEREINAFLSTDPYVIGTKPDPKVPNGIKYYVVSAGDPPPASIALIAGDALFNLRASLDHLAYQLAWVNGTRDERILKATYFPISDDAAKFQAEAPGKVKGMSKTAQDAIAATKPYKGGNDVLWRLHKLNNIDKHRILVTVGSPLSSHNLPSHLRKPTLNLIVSLQPDISPEWIAASASDTIHNLTLRPPVRKCPLEAGDELELAFSPILATDEKMEITFEVAFCEPQIAESYPIVETLKDMANVIDNIILGFKPLLV